MEKTNYTAEELALEMANNIGWLGCLLEDLEHVRNVLGRMAADAKEKCGSKLEPYFLYDNNDTLQTVDNLMFRLLKEINAEHKKIDEMQGQLHQLTKIEELEDKKIPRHCNDEESSQ